MCAILFPSQGALQQTAPSPQGTAPPPHETAPPPQGTASSHRQRKNSMSICCMFIGYRNNYDPVLLIVSVYFSMYMYMHT